MGKRDRFSSRSEREKRTLPGHARHTANLALFYDTPKLFMRLTANYHDAFLYQLGADKDLDEYYDKEFRLDFTGNYDLTKYMNVFVDVINITKKQGAGCRFRVKTFLLCSYFLSFKPRKKTGTSHRTLIARTAYT